VRGASWCPGGEVGEEAEPGLNAAAVYPHGDLRFTLEANVLSGASKTGEELDEERGNEDLRVVVTPGLFHRPSPEIEYGIGMPIGVTRAAPEWGIVGRMTIEFEFQGPRDAYDSGLPHDRPGLRANRGGFT